MYPSKLTILNILYYSHISEKSNTIKKSIKAHRRRWLTLYNEWPSLHVFSYNKCMFYPYQNHPCNNCNCDSQVSWLPHVSCHPMRSMCVSLYQSSSYAYIITDPCNIITL